MRYKITVEYLGTNYSGWQRQKNALSVQEVLEKPLSVLFQEPITLAASGRTDKGVHALGQVAHFDAQKSIRTDNVTMAVNSMLPDAIRIVKTEVASESFHARFEAKRKTYLYKFYVSRILSPTRSQLQAQLIPPADTDKMKEAVKDLLGTHDFAGFSSTGSHVKNTVRTIYNAELRVSGDELELEITGNGFLYNMVRIIAGTLAWIGNGKLPPNAIRTVFETKDRKKAGKTFPPEGLYLKEVLYPDFFAEN